MRVFVHELKKLWNVRLLALIALFGALTWFGFLAEGIHSYDSLTRHGAFLSYQTELFERYGETLEPHELADFDLPGKIAAVEAEGDAIIAAEPLFAAYGITGFIEFIEWSRGLPIEMWDDAAFTADFAVMHGALEGDNPETLEAWALSPDRRWEALRALEHWYVTTYPMWLESFIAHDMRPVVVRTAERLLEVGNTSLIHYSLAPEFSVYAAVVGVFAVIAVIFLVAPLLAIDRARRIHHMQYASKTGRKVLRKQFAAVVLSAGLLAVVLIAGAFAPFLALAGMYWNAPILSYSITGLWMYDLTFGQYVLTLAGTIIALSLAAASVAFILARFSTNMIAVLFKVIPAMAALSGIAATALNMALSDRNIVFTGVFGGRLTMPEVIVCAVLGVVGLLAAGFVAVREVRAEVAA